MAKYRPISPAQSWRSTRSSALDVRERYCEIYLLTSPFSNPIGCYPLVENIAAAEIGLSAEELLSMLSRLQSKGIIIYEYGHVLVRTWFFHNIWQSTLLGNVAKMALSDVAALPPELQKKWASACIEVGIPEEIVDQFIPKPLSAPLEEASHPLSNKNYNKTEHQTEHGTTNATKTNINEMESGSSILKINLLPIAENHRNFIEAAVCGLSPDDAQKIADEVCGALQAVKDGKREPIRGLHGWLPKLVERLHNDTFAPQWGLDVAARRKAAVQTQQRENESARQNEVDHELQMRERSNAEALLHALSPEDLENFAALAESLIPLRNFRPKIRESIVKREVPLGLGCAAVLGAAKEWRSKEGAKQ